MHLRVPPAVPSLACIGLLLTCACGGWDDSLPLVPTAFESPAPPSRPADCATVSPAEPLATRLAAALPGDSFCLTAGIYSGPIELASGITLWGPREAVLRSSGSGDTVRLTGPDARLLGVTVDGSGQRFDLQEAAVHVVSAPGARVRGVVVRNALFGVIVEKSENVEIVGNEIFGSERGQIGLRGDAIRVWETERSLIASNRVTGSRDIVIWYSSENRILDNEVVGGRYGTHFMYSHGNLVARNRYVANVVGIFAMYSRDLKLENNLLAASEGAAGMGLGLKESSGVRASHNLIVKNSVGIYIDNSPYEPGSTNVFARNAIRLCDVGVGFHSSTDNNHIFSNSLRGNTTQVRVDGGGHALGNQWVDNDFDDYAGYDLNRDGVGDVPYELRTFTGTLIARHPKLDYFRGTPALAMIDAASRILPVYQPEAVLIDSRPRTGRPRYEVDDAD